MTDSKKDADSKSEKVEIVDLEDEHDEKAHHQSHEHHEGHSHEKHHAKHHVKVEIDGSEKPNVWKIISIIMAVLLVFTVIIWIASAAGKAAPQNNGPGKQTVSANGKDQLLFLNSDACTTACDTIEPKIKQLATEANIGFAKSKFFQPLPVPGYVLTYNNTVYMGAIQDEPTFIVGLCTITNNKAVCAKSDDAQKEIAAAAAAAQQKALEGIPKKDKPTVELYVMGFCPYGVQAETAMAPVVSLFGSKADIKIRYIVSVSGDSLDNVQSLHGPVEGKEDARQLCVAKYYDQTTFWKYLTAINNNCYSIYRNGDDAYNTCWKKAATDNKIDVAKIETCMSKEGIDLINAETAADSKNSVSGSPTMIINGQLYQGARTPEAFKTAICNGFTTQPAECAKTLNSTGTAASGGCG
jgi:hypothetical protein